MRRRISAGVRTIDGTPECRTVGDYWHMLVTRPGNRARLIATISFLVATWLAKGTSTGLITLGLAVIIVFPLGFLWWRRFGGT